MNCIYCSAPVTYAYAPGWTDRTLATSDGAVSCPDPSALTAPGVLAGQAPRHQVQG